MPKCGEYFCGIKDELFCRKDLMMGSEVTVVDGIRLRIRWCDGNLWVGNELQCGKERDLLIRDVDEGGDV